MMSTATEINAQLRELEQRARQASTANRMKLQKRIIKLRAARNAALMASL